MRSTVLSSGTKNAEGKIIEGIEVRVKRGESKWKIVIEWGSKLMRCYFMPIHASAFVCMKSVYTLVCICDTVGTWSRCNAISLSSSERGSVFGQSVSLSHQGSATTQHTYPGKATRPSFIALFRAGLYLTPGLLKVRIPVRIRTGREFNPDPPPLDISSALVSLRPPCGVRGAHTHTHTHTHTRAHEPVLQWLQTLL